ncbi:MAG: hypothetical protein K2X87_18915, partial [Gemmataceae bacterium]|nr:hypothetical protein [Gemmataceae bacterium]
RAAGLVRAIRTDALAALAGSFDPAGTADYDHPVWKRFRSVAGPGRGRFHPTTTAKAHAAARTLFAEIIRDPDRLAALDGLAAEPDRAGEVYRTVVRDMDRQLRQRQAIMQRQMPWPGTTAAEVGYVLYLGTFPGTGVGADDRDAAREWAFGDRGVRGAYYLRQRLGLEEMTTPDPDLDTVSPAVMQLFLSWLAERDHPDTLRKGFEMTSAVGLDAPAALRAIDAARAVVANKRLPAKARAVGLPVLARLGSKADLPAFETLFADEAVVDTFRLSGAVPVDSPYDGTGAVQARDYAVGLALLLHGQDPAGYGFYMAQGRWNAAGGRADVTKYDPYHFGFVTGDDGRPATHAKARAWLAGQEKTDPPKVGGKVWDHYKAVVGDDKPARELFDRITADAKTRELLEAAAVGGHEAGKLYSDRGLELARLAREKTPASPEAVLGWLFAGTFPAADGKSPDVDDHLPHPNRNHPEPDETGLVRELTTGPQAAPARRVFAAWMAIQAKNGIIDRPLRVAIRCDIKEALPAARVALAAGHWQQTKRPPYGLDAPLLAIGKFGDETDLPRLAKFADDDRPTSGWHLAGGIVGRDPGKELEPVEGEDISVRVRDVAVAAMIARRGGKPEDFGFVWTKTDARKLIPWAGRVGDDPFGIDTPIGFARQADREAAHQKARAWLDQKK